MRDAPTVWILAANLAGAYQRSEVRVFSDAAQPRLHGRRPPDAGTRLGGKHRGFLRTVHHGIEAAALSESGSTGGGSQQLSSAPPDAAAHLRFRLSGPARASGIVQRCRPVLFPGFEPYRRRPPRESERGGRDIQPVPYAGREAADGTDVHSRGGTLPGSARLDSERSLLAGCICRRSAHLAAFHATQRGAISNRGHNAALV